MKPLVSIIVPVYNVGELVLKCLNSLISQSYEQIEIVVVDDGSTDGSGELCDDFAKKDKRIKVFHKKNGGLSSARNYGIKKTSGEYVCLVDSDDYVKKSFVKKMVEAVLSHNADVAVCGYNGEIPEAKVMTGEEAAVILLVGQNNMEIIAWNKMYKKTLFDDISYPEGKNYEDNLTTYKLLSKAGTVAYVAESLYVYVERGGSITNKDKKEEKLKSRELAAREAMTYFADGTNLGQAAEMLRNEGFAPQSLEFAQAFARKDAMALTRILCAMEKQPRAKLQELLEQWRQLLTEALLIRAGVAASPEAAEMGRSRTGSDLSEALRSIQKALDNCAANVGAGHICGWLLVRLR